MDKGRWKKPILWPTVMLILFTVGLILCALSLHWEGFSMTVVVMILYIAMWRMGAMDYYQDESEDADIWDEAFWGK